MTQRGAEAPEKTDSSAPALQKGGSAVEPGLPRMLNDRYRLERLIAKGGMGRVYLATQLPLERKVALKQLVRASLNDDFRRRFFLEASVLARLSHPNIVVVHDYGEAPDGSLFMAMEYLDGATLLAELRRSGRLQTLRALDIAAQVCRALRSAHRQGVAHRDLKPGNIMLLRDSDADGVVERDIVKVLDFGLVKVFQEDGEQEAVEQDITRAEVMLGSPRYMAPEQIQCTAVDARSDVYSLGVVLFAMLTGRPPFVGTTLEILNQHLEAEVPGLNDLTQSLKGFNAVDAEVEPLLNGITRKCMAKNPDDRYQSMDELLIELRTAYRLQSDDSSDIPPTLDIIRPSFSSQPPGEAARKSEPSAEDDPSAESSHERRRTDSGYRFSPTAEEDVAFSAAPELATLEEPSDDLPTPSGQLSAATPAPTRRALPFLLTVVLISLAVTAAVVVGVLLWAPWSARPPVAAAQLQQPQPLLPSGPPPTQPIPTGVKVSITSEPPGAQVIHRGALLGTTPLERDLDRTAPGDEEAFIFRLEGHQPLTLQAAISEESRQIHATLMPTEVTDPEPPTKVTDRDRVERRVVKGRPIRAAGETSAAGSETKAASVPAGGGERAQPEAPQPPATKAPERQNPLLIDEPRRAVPVVD